MSINDFTEVLNFSWGGTVCWAGMKIEAFRDHYLSAGTFSPPPPRILNWQKSPHRLGLNCDLAKVLFYNVVSYSIFTGNNVEIFLKSGEMVLYESAVAPHGRQFPLNGDFFDNLFVHYTLEDGDIYIK